MSPSSAFILLLPSLLSLIPSESASAAAALHTSCLVYGAGVTRVNSVYTRPENWQALDDTASDDAASDDDPAGKILGSFGSVNEVGLVLSPASSSEGSTVSHFWLIHRKGKLLYKSADAGDEGDTSDADRADSPLPPRDGWQPYDETIKGPGPRVDCRDAILSTDAAEWRGRRARALCPAHGGLCGVALVGEPMREIVKPGSRHTELYGLRDTHLQVVRRLVAMEDDQYGELNWMWTDGECQDEYSRLIGVEPFPSDGTGIPAFVVVQAAKGRYVKHEGRFTAKEMIGFVSRVLAAVESEGEGGVEEEVAAEVEGSHHGIVWRRVEGDVSQLTLRELNCARRREDRQLKARQVIGNDEDDREGEGTEVEEEGNDEQQGWHPAPKGRTDARGDDEADNGQKAPLEVAAMLREAAAATEATVDEQREPEEEAQRQQQQEQMQQAQQRKRERRSKGKYAKREGAFVLKVMRMAEAAVEAIRGGWHYVVDAFGSNGDAISDDATDGDSADTMVDTGGTPQQLLQEQQEQERRESGRQEDAEQIREVEEIEVSPLG